MLIPHLDAGNTERRQQYFQNLIFGVFVFLLVFTLQDVYESWVEVTYIQQNSHSFRNTNVVSWPETLLHCRILEVVFYLVVTGILYIVFYSKQKHW